MKMVKGFANIILLENLIMSVVFQVANPRFVCAAVVDGKKQVSEIVRMFFK